MNNKKAKMIRKVTKQYISVHAASNNLTYEEAAKNVVNETVQERTAYSIPIYSGDGETVIGSRDFTGQIRYKSGFNFTNKKLKEHYNASLRSSK